MDEMEFGVEALASKLLDLRSKFLTHIFVFVLGG